MSEAVHRPEQIRPPSLASRLFLLPFHLFGALCGALLVSITLECFGVAFFWTEQGWHHAEQMRQFEEAQLSSAFRQSVLIQTPSRAAHALMEEAYQWLFVKSGLTHTQTDDPNHQGFRAALGSAVRYAHTYLLAAAYTVQVFLLRLLVLVLTLPLFLLAAFTGLVDGLVRRDVRRFCSTLESGFVYHRARASLVPLASLPAGIYLALPVSVHPLTILLPGAALLGLAVGLAASTFKKYL